MGQGQVVGVALLGQGVDPRPAGIGQRQHPRRLVEGLARRVVHGLAQQLVAAVVRHAHQVAVSAGHHQAHERRRQFRMGQVIGGNVALNVVHGDQGLACGIAQALHAADAGEQRAHQPRAVGDGEGIHVSKAHVRLPQGLIHHPVAGLHMGAAGDLRHHAAIEGVEVDLAEHHIGDDPPPVLDNGGGGLVAGGFQGQDAHMLLVAEGLRLSLNRFRIRHGYITCYASRLPRPAAASAACRPASWPPAGPRRL